MRYLATLFAKSASYLRRVLRVWRSGGFYVEHPGHYLRERYGLDEKPEGRNKAVLHHFHASPDRHERGPAFSAAFMERARALAGKKPWHMLTRRERTLESAANFRQAALDLPAEPEPGVDPVLHEAMRQSFIAHAEELEREAAALELPPASE